MRPTKLIVTIIASAGLMLASACSREAEQDQAAESAASSADMAAPPPAMREAAADSAAAESEEAPGLTTTAAPGVAFSYRYAFTLAGEAISDVQQEHAAACEELGADRCQVTGMDYHKEDSGGITARLDFLVAPTIAHRFGKDATAIVREADGVLDNADVEGANAGGEIEASQLRSAGLSAELTRIEKRLKTPGISADEIRMLTARAEAIRAELRTEEGGRMENEKRLATTPMTFNYASQGLFAASGDPFGKAAENSWNSMKTMLGYMLTLLGVLLPWLLLAGLVALAVRGLRRRPVAGTAGDGAPPA